MKDDLKNELRDEAARTGVQLGGKVVGAFVEWLKTRPAVWRKRRAERRAKR